MAGRRVVNAVAWLVAMSAFVALIKRGMTLAQDVTDWKKIAEGYKWKVGERQRVIDQMRKAS